MGSLPNLKVIVLDGCKRVTDKGAAPLAKLVNLTRVRLNGTRVTTTTVRRLRALPFLSHLSVCGTHFSDRVCCYFLKGGGALETPYSRSGK